MVQFLFLKETRFLVRRSNIFQPERKCWFNIENGRHILLLKSEKETYLC